MDADPRPGMGHNTPRHDLAQAFPQSQLAAPPTLFSKSLMLFTSSGGEQQQQDLAEDFSKIIYLKGIYL